VQQPARDGGGADDPAALEGQRTHADTSHRRSSNAYGDSS
jgi:hypothetical protein